MRSRRIELAIRMRACAFALWFLLFASLARADASAREAIRMFLERETTGIPGRVSIELGAPDPQLRPAPCARIEPFIPGSARMWGRTSIGLRCTDGAAWSTYLQVNIHVFAPVLVANRSLSAGQPLAEDDYRVEEIDLTLHPGGILQDAAYADKKELARVIAAGQPLRREHFRPRAVVTPGDPVRLVYEGAGFTISTEAKSLGSATEGQAVRVQTESGKLITGVARSGRLVQVRQ